jgi:hypothetical protein
MCFGLNQRFFPEQMGLELAAAFFETAPQDRAAKFSDGIIGGMLASAQVKVAETAVDPNTGPVEMEVAENCGGWRRGWSNWEA